MKKIILLSFVSIVSFAAAAQKQNFDLLEFIAPQGWKKEIKGATVSFSKEDLAKGTYCLITLYKSMDAGEDADANFTLAWESLAKEPLGISVAPQMLASTTDNGWQAKSGSGAFEKDGLSGLALLVASSGYNKLVNILILTNSETYQNEMEKFLTSVIFKKPVATNVVVNNSNNTNVAAPAAMKTGYQFNTTNFDDGWTAVEQSDWVLVTKGTMKVYLHYDNTKINTSNTDPDKMCAAAWNVLVAPRYSNISEYRSAPNMLTFERPYFAKAFLTEPSTGKKIFVALFSKARSGWIEVVCPDEKTFAENFGIEMSKLDSYEYVSVYDPILKMATYNKFAVSINDLKGKWTNNFAGNTYYANVYTGMSAGMSTYTSGQEYEFFSGNKYKWHIVASNSYGGATKFTKATGEGTLSMNGNWEISFSNMEGKPKTAAAKFTCVKGGRVLWIDETALIPSGK